MDLIEIFLDKIENVISKHVMHTPDPKKYKQDGGNPFTNNINSMKDDYENGYKKNIEELLFMVNNINSNFETELKKLNLSDSEQKEKIVAFESLVKKKLLTFLKP